MSARTLDRSGAVDVYTTEKIGRTQDLTPEGFLLCRDVRIARTGEMLYGEGEVPIEPGPNGIITVTRGPEDLFRPETLASYLGKSVTDDHPDEDVTPLTWRDVAVGCVQNVRRGEGVDAEYLLADLLIQDTQAIAAVRDGKREVSCGYDADYEQTGPGRGRQFNIIGNHVALVDKGRCGPRCAIGDSDMKTRDKKRTWKDRILTAFKARDEEALTEAMQMADDEMGEGEADEPQKVIVEVRAASPAAAADEESEGEGEAREETNDEEAPAWFTAARAEDKSWRDSMEERISKLEGGTADAESEEGDDTDRTDDEDLDEGKTEDEEGEAEPKDEGTRDAATRDSASLQAAFQDMVARAEILAPGIKLPTFDGKATRKITMDRMCAFRRRALTKALEDAETSALLAPIVGAKPDMKKITCDGVRVMFTAASELVKSANTAITRTGYVHDQAGGAGPRSISDINAKNAEFWRAKGGLRS